MLSGFATAKNCDLGFRESSREDTKRVVSDRGGRPVQAPPEAWSELLESVCEVVLAKMLEDEDISVRRQVSVLIEVFGQSLRAFV